MINYEEKERKLLKLEKRQKQSFNEIGKLFESLLKRNKVIYDKNDDFGKDVLQLSVILDEFNIEDFDILFEQIKIKMIKYFEIRCLQNLLSKELDVLRRGTI